MPQTVDHEMRRRQLTEATAREIARVGLASVRLRDVAGSAGWPTGTLTYYFAGKRQLLLATFRSRTELAHAYFEAAAAGGGSLVRAKVEAILPLDAERLLNWKVWLAFWGAAVGDDELAAEQEHRYDVFRKGLAEAVTHDQDTGFLARGHSADVVARYLATLLDGVAVQAVFAPGQWPQDEQRRVVEGYLRALDAAHQAITGGSCNVLFKGDNQ